jgi:hypothetical protein
MPSQVTRWILAAGLTLTTAVPSVALELQGKMLCTWREQGQECVGPRCFNWKNTGERAFWIDLDNRSLCAHRDPLQCAEWLRLDVVQHEPAKKTVLLIAYRVDAVLTYRISESGKVLGAIMVGIDRVVVTDGVCEQR